MRGQRYVDSVRNVYNLLVKIAANPEKYSSDVKVRTMLFSISNMCAYDDPERSIKRCSKNTFKKVATNTIMGGFVELDNQRKASKEILADVTKASKPSSKQGSMRSLLAENKSLREDLQRLEATLAQLMIVIHDLRDLSYQLAHRDDIIDPKRYWEKRIRDINLIFQLTGR